VRPASWLKPENTVQIHLNHRHPRLQVVVLRRLAIDGAGIVHQNIWRTHGRRHRFRTVDPAPSCCLKIAAKLREFWPRARSHRWFHPRAADSVACHRCPSLRQRNGDCSAKPGGGSCDQRKLSVETKPIKNSHRLPRSILWCCKQIVNARRNENPVTSPGMWDNICKGYMSGLVQIGSQPAQPAALCAPVPRSHAVLWLQTVTLAWMLIGMRGLALCSSGCAQPLIAGFRFRQSGGASIRRSRAACDMGHPNQYPNESGAHRGSSTFCSCPGSRIHRISLVGL